eukprot:gb/GECH01005085.1/.p1 GENE.gb/GECH01005085.1/~~gb/GECH01005085.1/.p1  ORF type:complete len:1255 (+),score=357.08 gb/GECH01005085.1/:1-3765(+)
MGDSNDDANVKVMIRVRPPNSKELGLGYDPCLAVENNTVRLDTRPEPRMFTFDQVAGPQSNQRNIFESVGRPLVDGCLDGYNGTVFAYGQTGSGKTYTMLGPSMEVHSDDQRGLIPRMFEYLFSRIKDKESENQVSFLCKCSYLEIYNEQISDLLTGGSDNLNIRQSINQGPYVEGLHEQVVTTSADTAALLVKGNANRHTGATGMNKESSRSHSVFTVTVESKTQTSSGVTKVRMSRLNLIDLAGSERQKMTRTKGIALKEASNINKSLSALGRVITALVDVANGKQRHVHYRDSKLTFLLRDSLGGNSRTFIIAAVSPSDACFGETLGTLKFAQRAKYIRNKPIVNEDMSGSVTVLQDEIKRLRQEVAVLKSHSPSKPSITNTTEPCNTNWDQVNSSHEFNHQQQYQNEPSSTTNSSPNDDVQISNNNQDNQKVVLARDKRVQELEQMLVQCVDHLRNTEAETERYTKRAEYMESLVERKNHLLQSTRMVLRFTKQRLKGNDVNTQELRQAIDMCLQPEYSPMVMEYVLENMELRNLLEDRLGDIDDVELTEMELEVGRAKKYIESLVEHIRQLVEDKHMLSNQISHLEQRASNSDTPGSGCIMTDDSPQIQQLKEEITAKTRSEENLIQRLESTSNQITNIQSEKHSLQEELDNLKTYISKMEEHIREQETRHQQELEKNHEERRQLEQNMYERHQQEIVEIRQSSGANERSLESRISEYVQEKESLQHQIHTLQDELETVKNQNANLNSQHEQFQQQLQQAQTMQQQEQNYYQENTQNMQQQHETEINQLYQDYHCLEKQLKETQEQLSSERERTTEYQDKFYQENDVCGSMQQKIDTLKEKLSHSEQESQELRESMETVQEELDHNQMLLGGAQERAQLAVQQISEMDAHINSLNEEINRLQSQASERSDELFGRIQEREQRRVSVEQRLEYVERLRSDEQSTIRSLEERVESTEQERSSVHAELLEWKNKHHNLGAKHDQMKEKNAMLQDRIKEMETQEQELRDEINTQQNKWETLSQNASNTENSLRQEIQSLYQRMEDIQHHWQQEQQEKTSFKEQLNQVHSELEDTRETADELRQELNALRREKDYMEDNISQLQQQNAKLSGHRNPRQRIQHHIKVKEENNQLRKERIGLMSAIEERDKEIRNLRHMNSNTAADKENMSVSNSFSLSSPTPQISDALRRACRQLATATGTRLPDPDNMDDLVKWCMKDHGGQHASSTSVSSSRSRTRRRGMHHTSSNSSRSYNM